MESSFAIEQYLPPLKALLFPLLSRRLRELGLFDIEAHGTGLVKPMLLLPVSLPPEEIVIVTGEEAGDEAVFTIFTMNFAFQKRTKNPSNFGGKDIRKRNTEMKKTQKKKN